MSKYCWESGTIIIPSAAWAGFKKNIRETLNLQIEKEFETATLLYEKTLQLGKGKRNFSYSEACCNLISNSRQYDHVSMDDMVARLFPKSMEAGVKPVRPLKKDFPKFTNKSLTFSNDFCSVILNDKARTARWNVQENNRAVDDARDSALGEAFFAALRKVKWTRGSGGQLVGNDEYNSDNQFVGGGGNYVTATYPPPATPKRTDCNYTGFGRYAGIGRRY